MSAIGDGETYSANEASCITGVPLREVHRIIDAELLGSATQGGRRARTVHERALLGLKFDYETRGDLTPGFRRRLLETLVDEPEASWVGNGVVSVKIQEMRDNVASERKRLAVARKIVSCDETVLSGTPCIVGTRIPVHDIADMLANGDSLDAIVEAFPQLNEECINLAALYARAYPRRGRPRRKPFWRDRKPVASSETRLDDLAQAG